MPTIAHPERPNERIEVEVVDSESHHQFDAVQVEAVSDSVSLSDVSGEQPWLPADEVQGR